MPNTRPPRARRAPSQWPRDLRPTCRLAAWPARAAVTCHPLRSQAGKSLSPPRSSAFAIPNAGDRLPGRGACSTARISRRLRDRLEPRRSGRSDFRLRSSRMKLPVVLLGAGSAAFLRVEWSSRCGCVRRHVVPNLLGHPDVPGEPHQRPPRVGLGAISRSTRDGLALPCAFARRPAGRPRGFPLRRLKHLPIDPAFDRFPNADVRSPAPAPGVGHQDWRPPRAWRAPRE